MSAPSQATAAGVPPDLTERVSLILDYAEFCGIQKFEGEPDMELWTLRKAIPGHPKNSTVTRQTLEKAIFPQSTP